MTPRERIFAALGHRGTDRLPRCEIWIDAFVEELGQGDPAQAYANTGQDAIMMTMLNPIESNAWRDGIDEWGRIWEHGQYRGGAISTWEDVSRYSPPPDHAASYFDDSQISDIQRRYPEHALIFGTHIGPFTAAYLAMGFDAFFVKLYDDPALVKHLMALRTEWCIAVLRYAIELGAEIIVLGDDAGTSHGPMIHPVTWRKLVYPLHKRITESLDVPVIWHSDGNIEPLLPMAVQAGFTGIHGIDPIAGMNLYQIRRTYGDRLALIGNVNTQVLCVDNIQAVQSEINRCLEFHEQQTGYMIATNNSIFDGMHLEMVMQYFDLLALACQQEHELC